MSILTTTAHNLKTRRSHIIHHLLFVYNERKNICSLNDKEKPFIYNKKSIEKSFGLKKIKSNIEGFGKEKTLTEQGISSYFDTNCISLRKW